MQKTKQKTEGVDVGLDVLNDFVEEIANQSTKKKADEESIELRFIKFFKLNQKKYKIDLNTNELFEFNNTYYTLVNDNKLKEEANRFITQYYPSKLSEKNISSSIKTLKSSGFPSLEQEESNIIPFLDFHLKIDEQGDFKAVSANSSTNFRYVINMNLEDLLDPISNEVFIKDYIPDGYFKRFIESSIEDVDDRNLVQEYLGYTLLNTTKFQVCQYWQGGGSNGKGVLMKLIEKMHKKTITLNLSGNNNFAYANLPNSSLVLVPETDKNIKENDFKSLVAGDLIEINKKNKDSFTYTPTAKFIFSGNGFPAIKDFSDGVWRRLQIIHFNKQFKEDDTIVDLEKLIYENEFSIFVEWCLVGLKRLLKRQKFILTDKQKDIVEKQKTESNSVYNFIEDYSIKIDNACETSKTKIFSEYCRFCDENGFLKYNSVNFWKIMRMKLPYSEIRKKDKENLGSVRKIRFVNISI